MDRRMATDGGSIETSLKSWGTSRGIRIPKKICEWLGIAIGSKLTVRADRDDRGAYLVIRPIADDHRSFSGAPGITMEEAFAGYSGDYVPCEADWGDDVGAEEVR